jgi:hypothetical protein
MTEHHQRRRRSHARSRALQRAGITLTRELHDDLVRRIERQELPGVYACSHSRTAYAVTIDGQVLHLIYHKSARTIVSVKTPEMY